MRKRTPSGPEWPTVALVALCYLTWGALTLAAASLPLAIVVPLLAVAITLHSSLQHEVIHGHPLPSRTLSEALVFPPIGLFVPYQRFRELHRAHHRDSNLTDPYDDPESFYLDPVVWHQLPLALRGLFRMNNTLLGRMLLGPAISIAAFVAGDLRAIRRGDRAILRAWLLHGAGLVLVAAWLALVATIPLPAYIVGAYLGFSVLTIRTFLEHQAHERAGGRTVIIEDRGPLALLFLNNNFHAVHHAHPQVPWYALPGVYAARRDEFLRRNLGYRYPSYAAIFRRYLLRPKEPVPHPLRRKA